jgi:anti-sigma factor RsiW
MTCADIEILLCDYVDDTLRGSQKSALEDHLSGCAACAEMAADIKAAMGFMERAAVVEPPAGLMTRILHVTPAVRQPWWRRGFLGKWAEWILQPRYAMGMAMTILSFAMIARFSPVQIRQLRPADLNPVKIYLAVDDRAHRTWDRTMKYYENLRWVIELQSRVTEFTEQEQEQQKQKASAVDQKKSKR